jgi:hypothetical protein
VVELVETNGQSDLDKLDHPGPARSPGASPITRGQLDRPQRPARGLLWTDEGEATKERVPRREEQTTQRAGHARAERAQKAQRNQ